MTASQAAASVASAWLPETRWQWAAHVGFILIIIAIVIVSLPGETSGWQQAMAASRCDGRQTTRIDRQASQCIKFTGDAQACYARVVAQVCKPRSP